VLGASYWNTKSSNYCLSSAPKGHVLGMGQISCSFSGTAANSHIVICLLSIIRVGKKVFQITPEIRCQ
jgi:hypothetical protein